MQENKHYQKYLEIIDKAIGQSHQTTQYIQQKSDPNFQESDQSELDSKQGSQQQNNSYDQKQQNVEKIINKDDQQKNIYDESNENSKRQLVLNFKMRQYNIDAILEEGSMADENSPKQIQTFFNLEKYNKNLERNKKAQDIIPPASLEKPRVHIPNAQSYTFDSQMNHILKKYHHLQTKKQVQQETEPNQFQNTILQEKVQQKTEIEQKIQIPSIYENIELEQTQLSATIENPQHTIDQKNEESEVEDIQKKLENQLKKIKNDLQFFDQKHFQENDSLSQSPEKYGPQKQINDDIVETQQDQYSILPIYKKTHTNKAINKIEKENQKISIKKNKNTAKAYYMLAEDYLKFIKRSKKRLPTESDKKQLVLKRKQQSQSVLQPQLPECNSSPFQSTTPTKIVLNLNNSNSNSYQYNYQKKKQKQNECKFFDDEQREQVTNLRPSCLEKMIYQDESQYSIKSVGVKENTIYMGDLLSKLKTLQF